MIIGESEMGNKEKDDSKLELNQLFKQLKKDWWQILIYSALGLLIALVIAFAFVKPKYSSTIDLVVSQKTSNVTEYTTQQADLNAIETYKDVLKRTIILKPVVKELREKDNYKGSSNTLKNSVKINNQEKSQVIGVTVTGLNRYVVADAANIIGKVFTKKIKEIMKVNNVTVVTTAQPAQAPFAPNKKMYGIIGFLFGLLVGLLISIFKFINNTKVTDVAYLTEELGLANLATISHFSRRVKDKG